MSTIIQQGSFTQAATAVAKTIKLRSDVDWFRCLNLTIADATQTTAVGVEYFWQRGFAADRGIEYKKSNAANAADMTDYLASGGFTLVSNTDQTPGAKVAVTGLSAAAPPVATAATALAVGDIVRFESLDNQPQISGIDFSVTAANQIGNISLVNSTASTAGFYRRVPYDPIFYPRRRYVTWVENAANPKVYLSVTHEYVVGEIVTLSFPGGTSVWGDYAQLDGVTATVIALNQTRAGSEPNNGTTANNIQLNIDTSAYTAWNASFGAALNQAYPASTKVPFTPAQVLPSAQNTGYSLSSNVDILAAAIRNDAYIGLKLATGANSPAGAADDVIYWQAGKSYLVDNSGLLVV